MLVGAVDAVWFGSEVLVEFGAVAELAYHQWRAACVEIGTSQRRNTEVRIRTIGPAEKETAVESGPAADHRRLARRPVLNDPVQLIGPASLVGNSRETFHKCGTRRFESGSLPERVMRTCDLKADRCLDMSVGPGSCEARPVELLPLRIPLLPRPFAGFVLDQVARYAGVF